MRRLDCAQLIDLAPELAVGNLSGDERAAVIAHLETCASCQQVVTSFTTVTDRLLLLAPRVEPPPGFEQRVLASLAPDLPEKRRVRRPRRKRATLVGALALALTFVSGGLLLDVGSSAQPALAGAEMRTASGEVVGQIFLHREQPVTLFMTLPGWAEQIQRYGRSGDTYSLRIERSDGQTLTRPVTLADDASWATTLDVDADAVTAVALVDSRGYIWCQAQFGPSSSDR